MLNSGVYPNHTWAGEGLSGATPGHSTLMVSIRNQLPGLLPGTTEGGTAVSTKGLWGWAGAAPPFPWMTGDEKISLWKIKKISQWRSWAVALLQSRWAWTQLVWYLLAKTYPAKQEIPGVSLWHCLWLQGKQEKCTGSHWYFSQPRTWCLAVGPNHGAAWAQPQSLWSCHWCSFYTSAGGDLCWAHPLSSNEASATAN